MRQPMRQSAPARPDLAKIQFIAANYRDLQGLRFLPLAVVLILVPLVTGSIITGTLHSAVLIASPVLVLGSWVFARWARRYYETRFGLSRPPRRSRGEQLKRIAVPLLILAVAMGIQVSGIESSLPFSPSWAVLWLAVFAWSLRRLRFAPHYAWLSGIGIALAMAPLGWLGEGDAHPYASEPWGLLVVGLVMGAMSGLDHRLLVRTMGHWKGQAPSSKSQGDAHG